MNLTEILENLNNIVSRYENIPLIETNELSEILRDLGCNLSYLITLRKEYYNQFQRAKRSSNETSDAGKTREAEYQVPELDEIRKVYSNYNELRSDLRTQISLWKQQ